MDQPEAVEISGVLEKRRQNLKFHWRTYQFILRGSKLSYYKMRGSQDKEGELWGTIDIRDVTSLQCVEVMGARFPMEVMLRSGKVILLAADSSAERAKWLQALQEQMFELSSRRVSDTPVVRERSADLSRGIGDWMRKSDPVSESRSQDCDKDADELGDLDSFIDQTFNGISYNRQSQIKKGVSQKGQKSEEEQDGNRQGFKTAIRIKG
ncbi:uncharacterized protein PAF06_013981 [Gastrophryne carolinensis]